MKSPRAIALGDFNSISERVLFAGYDNHHDQIQKESWNTTGDESDQECKAEPKGTDAEEFCQSATDAGHNAIPG
jgi:hypothetical protein